MTSQFETQYIKHLASIVNTYSDALIMTKRAKLILGYKGVEIKARNEHRNPIIRFINNFRP